MTFITVKQDIFIERRLSLTSLEKSEQRDKRPVTRMTSHEISLFCLSFTYFRLNT